MLPPPTQRLDRLAQSKARSFADVQVEALYPTGVEEEVLESMQARLRFWRDHGNTVSPSA